MILLISTTMNVSAQSKPSPQNDDDFVIKRPGEITFTSGIVIEGRVEKPQVLLIMTKEKTKLPELKLKASMLRFIEEPVIVNQTP
jgi:hypothetical protein